MRSKSTTGMENRDKKISFVIRITHRFFPTSSGSISHAVPILCTYEDRYLISISLARCQMDLLLNRGIGSIAGILESWCTHSTRTLYIVRVKISTKCHAFSTQSLSDLTRSHAIPKLNTNINVHHANWMHRKSCTKIYHRRRGQPYKVYKPAV